MNFNLLEEFSKTHHSNIFESKFYIGEQIILSRIDSYTHLNVRMYTIDGIRITYRDEVDKPIFEFTLEGFPYLWCESELEKLTI